MEIYFIGLVIAFILGCRLLYKERNKKDIQYDMIAPLTLMSWVSVFLILWKCKDKLI